MADVGMLLLGLIAVDCCGQGMLGEIINTALNKPAEMSSTYFNSRYNFSASTAVDGNTGSTVIPNIIHTATERRFAWWKVDLLTAVQDATVKMYFRTDNTRRRRIQLFTSTTPFSTYPGTESQRCYTYTSPVPDVLSVNCTGTWRYLLVYTDQDGGGGAILDFAEVQVLVCSTETYGDSCHKLCNSRHCVSSSDSCDHVAGECTDGCESGWNGTDCTFQCLNGTYGANCVKSCSVRKCRAPSSSCVRETGLCPDGCLDGWRGEDCNSQCPEGSFGQECISCSERHCQGESDCPEDGTCSGGCQDGWVVTNCTQGCPSGTYGPYCGLLCGNCSNADICDHETGECPSGCKPGWHGSQCKLGLQGIENTGKDSVTSYVIGAVIGFLVAVVTGSVLLICLIRHGRLQWKKGPISKGPKEFAEMTDVSSPQAVDQHSSTTHVYNNDYAVLDSATHAENNDYDAIKAKYYENL